MFPSFSLVAVATVFVSSVLAGDICSRTYQVQVGDICDSISAVNSVSTYQLAALNPTIDAHCSNLQPGQSLCLGTPGEDCQSTYVVALGDTCNSVMAAAGVNITIFEMNNPQIDSDCHNLYVGEVVCTAPTVLVPIAPAAPWTAPQGPVSSALPSSTASTATAYTTVSTTPVPTTSASSTSTADSSSTTDDQDLPWCDDEDDDGEWDDDDGSN